MNIKKMMGAAMLVAGLMVVHIGVAQAPAGATGLCNDGTYWKSSIKVGACTGHKGLKTWYGAVAKTTTAKPATTSKTTTAKTSKSAPAAAPTPASKPAVAPAPAAASAPAKAAPAAHAKTSTSSLPQAAGGGPGLVWVNTASNVYHCPGTQYYGKTKAGAYMSESDAKAKGAHPVGGKACK